MDNRTITSRILNVDSSAGCARYRQADWRAFINLFANTYSLKRSNYDRGEEVLCKGSFGTVFFI